MAIEKEPVRDWAGSEVADTSWFEDMDKIYLCTDYSLAKIAKMLRDEFEWGRRREPFLFSITCAGKTICLDDLILYALWPDKTIPARQILVPLLAELPKIFAAAHEQNNIEEKVVDRFIEEQVVALFARVLAEAVGQAA